MEIPIEMWNTLITTISMGTMIGVLYWTSKIIYNLRRAFRKPDKVVKIQYQNCKVYPEKMEMDNYY